MSSAQVKELQDHAACDGIAACNMTENVAYTTLARPTRTFLPAPTQPYIESEVIKNAGSMTHLCSPFLQATSQPHIESEVRQNEAIEMAENPAYSTAQQPVKTPATEDGRTGQGQMPRTQAGGTYDYIESYPGVSESSNNHNTSKRIPESMAYIDCI